MKVVDQHREGWEFFQAVMFPTDIGANRTWLMGLYAAKTDRIQILYDDDVLFPEYGEVYETLIAPALDVGAGFATWEASFFDEDGSRRPSRYWSGPTRFLLASELLKIVGMPGRLSLSPILGVFDRATAIRACEEAQKFLDQPANYTRPGMLIGNDLLIYYRHIERSKFWLYIEQPLCGYGVHAGSETISHERAGSLRRLTNAYDLARVQGSKPAPDLGLQIELPSSPVSTTRETSPVIQHVFSHTIPGDIETLRRYGFARSTWYREYRASPSRWRPIPVSDGQLSRDGKSSLGDLAPVPFIRDLIQEGVKNSEAGDIIFLTNSDVCFVPGITEKLLRLIAKHGAAFSYRWDFPAPMLAPVLTERGLERGTWYLGCDAFAFSVEWWAKNGQKFPDMVLGRHCWDTVMRGLMKLEGGVNLPAAIYHEVHRSFWNFRGAAWRDSLAGNIHNAALARKFFQEFNCGGNDWRTAEDVPRAAPVESGVSVTRRSNRLSQQKLALLRGPRFSRHLVEYMRRHPEIVWPGVKV